MKNNNVFYPRSVKTLASSSSRALSVDGLCG
jgi:hypothetical protein